MAYNTPADDSIVSSVMRLAPARGMLEDNSAALSNFKPVSQPLERTAQIMKGGDILGGAIPPPPPGFKLDSASAVPPPPPGFKLDAAAQPLPAEPGYATERGGSPAPNAVALRETIVGTSDKPQADLFAAKQEIEKRLRAEGKSDAEIEKNPEWQAASRNLSRSVSAAGSQTAIGAALGMLGPEAAPAISKGVSRAVGAMPAAKEAVAKEGASALRTEAVGQAEKQIGTSTQAAQTPRFVDTASTQAKAKTAAQGITEARAAVAQADTRVTAATQKVTGLKTRLAAADKYAQPGQRSASNVRDLRQQFTDAQKELEAAKAQREAKTTALTDATNANKEARSDVTTLNRANQQQAAMAKSAQKVADKYSTLRNQLQEEKDPAGLARLADGLFNDLRKNGLLTDEQHTRLLRQVDQVQGQVKSATAARQRMQQIIRHGIAYGVAGGIGYEGGRVLRGIMP